MDKPAYTPDRFARCAAKYIRWRAVRGCPGICPRCLLVERSTEGVQMMRVLRNNQMIAEYKPPRTGGTKHLLSTDPLLAVLREADAHSLTLTMREMRDAAHISSTSVVRAQLHRLEREGMVESLGVRAARGYRLTSQGRGAATPDELLLKRCLVYLETELSCTGGDLVSDLRERLS